jgi:hypothetical protein
MGEDEPGHVVAAVAAARIDGAVVVEKWKLQRWEVEVWQRYYFKDDYDDDYNDQGFGYEDL